MFTRIVWALLISIVFSLSQNLSLKFEKLSSEDGLSQNTIYDILQDQQGYMWFATQDGLNRYDGYDFKVYRQSNSSQKASASNYLNCITESPLKQIWVGTITGLSILDPVTEQFTTFSNYPSLLGKNISEIIRAADNTMWVATMGAGISHLTPDGRLIDTFLFHTDSLYAQNARNVKTIFEDKSNNIWIGTDNGGLFKIVQTDSNKVVQYPQLHFLDNEIITALSQCSDGNIWIGTAQQGIYTLNPRTSKIKNYFHNNKNRHSIIGNTIRTIYKDQDQRTWIGTEDGLSLFLSEVHEFQNYQHDPKNPESLSNNDVNSITMDKSGNIWIGTNNRGINRFSKFYTFFTNYQAHTDGLSGLSSNIVWSFLEEADGRVWIGTESGLDIYDPQKKTITNILHHKKQFFTHKTIRRIFKDNKGDFWLATDGGGINIFNPRTKKIKIFEHDPQNKNSLSGNRVRDIVEDKDGAFWIATLKGLNHYNPTTKQFTSYKNSPTDASALSDDRILDLYMDRSNQLWLATYNGLNRFNTKTEKFTSYKPIAGDSTSLSSNIIVSFYKSPKDPPGIYWVGTDNGLNQFDSQTGKFKQYLNSQGSQSTVIYSINEDRLGNLWLATGHGLIRFSRQDGKIKSFNTSSGLLNDEFNASATLRLSNDDLVFGGVKGITFFNPMNIPENKITPNIVITAFKKYDQTINVDSLVNSDIEMQLSYKDKFISFEFAALDYTNSFNNKYKYKLEGFDPEWIDSGNRRFASYTNLDGGNYTFHVQGTNNDGLWNVKGAELKFYIQPPFWATIWFRVLFVLFIGIFIRVYLSMRISRVKNQKEHLQKEVNTRTKELYRRNIDLKMAQKEKDAILENVEEGFFLLDTNLIIQSQYSAALLNILEMEKPDGKEFTKLISTHLQEQDTRTAVEYIEILKDPEIDEDLIISLNPLAHAEFYFQREDNSLESKFLSFNFQRILEQDKLTHLIVTVVDETEEHSLKKQLSESEENAKRQMEWIMGILHLDPSLLLEFVQSTTDELDNIESVLREDLPEKDFSAAITFIARSLHLIKGNANLLDLKSFGIKVHDIENSIKHLLGQTGLKGSDFVGLVGNLKDLRNSLAELSDLIGKISRFNHPQKEENENTNSIMLRSIENMIRRISEEQKKEVKLDCSEMNFEHIPPQLRLLLKNTLIQLVRNSLTHGLETPDERITSSKEKSGYIKVSSQLRDSLLIIEYLDDGRGLQLSKLKQKAIESGRWETSDVQSWDEHQIEEVIFVPGISSADNVDMLGGRGIGMDLIRDRLKSHDGKIEVESKTSEYCKFKITLPITHIN